MSSLIWILVNLIIIVCLVLSLVLPLGSLSNYTKEINQNYDKDGVKAYSYIRFTIKNLKYYFTKSCIEDRCSNLIDDKSLSSTNDKVSYALNLTAFISVILTIAILALCTILTLTKVNFKYCKLLNILAIILSIYATIIVLLAVVVQDLLPLKLDVGGIMLIIGTSLFILKNFTHLLIKN